MYLFVLICYVSGFANFLTKLRRRQFSKICFRNRLGQEAEKEVAEHGSVFGSITASVKGFTWSSSYFNFIKSRMCDLILPEYIRALLPQMMSRKCK